MYIKTSIKNSIGYLNIDRPESLNAMNDEVLDEFISKINDLNSEPKVRVIIISGAGDKAFIAGGDEKEPATIQEINDYLKEIKKEK